MTTNYERAFAEHPDVYRAWRALVGAITARMDARRYELATFAAAQARRSSYCSLAHGEILAGRFGVDVARLGADPAGAGLDATDAAVMAFAAKVARDPASVDPADHERLRDAGLDDAEIMDVAVAASARCFFSGVLDAMLVAPDERYAGLPDALRRVLVVGRPIAGA